MKKVFIASVLKPVTDPRMYRKIGLSLADKGYKVHIAGHFSPVIPAKKVIFYPLFKFKRISFKRLLAPIQILTLALKLKPDVFIVTTQELLLTAVIFSWISKKPVIYDVQENYYKNLVCMKTFPAGIRDILGLYTRLLEKVTAPFFSGYILAEEIYEKELGFIGENYVIAQNKFQKEEGVLPKSVAYPIKDGPVNFLYSGTISEEFGIWRAISLVEKLNSLDNSVSLTIVGYCAKKSLRGKLHDYLKKKSFITANIFSKPVPYNIILKSFKSVDFLLLPYQVSKVFQGKVPTKLFEGLALNIPMIVQYNPEWEDICDKYKAAVFIDYERFNSESLDEDIRSASFYTSIPGKEVLWESEKGRMIKFIERFL